MKIRLALILLALGANSWAGEGAFVPYTPHLRVFSCEIPYGWQTFEEDEPGGFAAHLLGPDNAAGTYRAGIDIHWVDSAKPGFVRLKNAIDAMRRSDKNTKRAANSPRRISTGAGLARFLEVRETRRLLPEQAPSKAREIHHQIAVIPSGESYVIVRLSAAEEDYVNYKEIFLRLLKSFQISG